MEEARKWYGEAARHSSTNYFAYFNFANLSMVQGNPEQNPEVETDLRKAVELNPRFYPASDMLASILMSKDQVSDAIAVMQSVAKVAVAPGDAARAQMKIKQLEQMQSARSQMNSNTSSAGSESGVVDIIRPDAPVRTASQAGATVVVNVDSGPNHPTEPPNGPKHELLGTMHGVKCSYPSVIEFNVEGAKKTVSLYTNNYFKLDLTVLGFTPKGDIHPCEDLEGMKARVQYAESSDKTVDGQVIAIELRK
jgi:hypothetical protein